MPNPKQKYEMELLGRKLELDQACVAPKSNSESEKIQIPGDERPIVLRELILRLIARLERI